MWYSPRFSINGKLEDLAGDLELVNGVKPHPHRVDVAQFGCDQVLHRIHVLFVVVGDTPRSGPSADELAVLALPGHSNHQNIIAYLDMRQSLPALPHAVPLKPSHRCIDPAVSAPLQVGTTNSRVFRESAPAGTQIARWPWSSTRYSCWESNRPPQLPLVRRAQPLSSGTYRSELVAPTVSLPAKRTSVYLMLACTPTAPPGRVTHATTGLPSSSHRQGCAR